MAVNKDEWHVSTSFWCAEIKPKISLIQALQSLAGNILWLFWLGGAPASKSRPHTCLTKMGFRVKGSRYKTHKTGHLDLLMVSSAWLRWCAPCCFEGQKWPLWMELTATLKVLLLTKIMRVAKQPRCSSRCTKLYHLNSGKIFASCHLDSMWPKYIKMITSFFCLWCNLYKYHFKWKYRHF